MNAPAIFVQSSKDDELMTLLWFDSQTSETFNHRQNAPIHHQSSGLRNEEILCLDNVQTVWRKSQELLQCVLALKDTYLSNKDIEHKLSQMIEHLDLLQQFMNIVQELLTNCRDESTMKLESLKQIQANNHEFRVNAMLASDVNLVAIGRILDFVLNSLFKRMLVLQVFCKGKANKWRRQLLFEARVLYSELNMMTRIFASAIDTPQDDLMCVDRQDPRWKQIQEIKRSVMLADARQIQSSYDKFTKSIRLGHAIIFKRNQFRSKLLRNIIFLMGGMWYFLQDKKTRNRALAHMCTMEPSSASEVMNLIEMPGIKHFLKIGLPMITMNKKIYLDSVVSPITESVILSETQACTLNRITVKPIQLVNIGIHQSSEQVRDLFSKTNQKIRIRILCHKHLNQVEYVPPNLQFDQPQRRNLMKQFLGYLGFINRPQEYFERIIIHIHGGGFIAMSSGSHQCYTRVWANKLKVPVFSIDYGLAPKYPYPTAVDDCWQAYQWILNYLQNHFSITLIQSQDVTAKQVILAGDSAGGNLCCAITGLAIKYGCQVPDGIFLAYPCLDLKFKYSPSHLNGLKDAILSHTAMDICIKSYTDYPHCKAESDPFLSPVKFSDEILKLFPPVRIMLGALDPLSDQINVIIKLIYARANNIDVKIVEYQDMSHGFLSFYVIQGMKEVYRCIQDSLGMLQELMNL